MISCDSGDAGREYSCLKSPLHPTRMNEALGSSNCISGNHLWENYRKKLRKMKNKLAVA